MKKIEKDIRKSKIQNHECKGLGLVFLNLNRFRYIYKPKPNDKNKEAAPKLRKQTLHFLIKFSKLKT